MERYAIGLDFGTLSGRCLLLNAVTGEEVATSVVPYKHGVMDQELPDGTKLKMDYALQDPKDYIDVLSISIHDVLRQARINPEQIIGVGVDVTGCTPIPLDHNGIPLCFTEKYANRPHAYIKLWKHHAAQAQADRINLVAKKRCEPFLNRYGGRISCEWLFPKLLQIYEEDREVYNQIGCFLEVTDWITYLLTGVMVRNTSGLGWKGIWDEKVGFPSEEFFEELSPGFGSVVKEKIKGKIQQIGTKAGEITPEAAKLTGLKVGTAVAVGNFDAAGAATGSRVITPGVMLALIGTSTCHMLLGYKVVDNIPGICGVVKNGMIPNTISYEAGQNSVGDLFDWFVKGFVPASYFENAKNKGVSIHNYLSMLSFVKKPGENGLLALDWLTGNRSILVNGKLSCMILGSNVLTRPEDVYRALLESTAFGTRVIIENFREHGISVESFIAAGGIPNKNPIMMQIYADILRMDIKISGSMQNCALSSAIWGVLAAGEEKSGYKTLDEAVIHLSNLNDKIYHPNKENYNAYNFLYSEYLKLHNYFGRGENDVMIHLKKFADEQKTDNQ